jgi:hypothetical protein
MAPTRDMAPFDVRNPVTPVKADGQRTDPPVSVPKVNGSKPSDTDIADPLDDPPE